MSLIKSIRQQLGLSGTPANNFTLDASADNGTMKLARGNAGATTQDIMTVDAAGKVEFPAGSNEIGVGQTWQTVTRVIGTTYTNSTGKPIQVAVGGSLPSAAQLGVSVSGLQLANLYNGTAAPMYQAAWFIVPPGATYSANVIAGSPLLASWVELR
jgi:hypothetical protein